jgi:hypothetical protein
VRTFGLGDNQLSGALPNTIGNMVSMQELFLQGNSGLTGALPLTMTNVDLGDINFTNTNLCIPFDADFHFWMVQIQSIQSPGIICGYVPPELGENSYLPAVLKDDVQ